MSVDSTYLSNFVNRGTKLICLLVDPQDETKSNELKRIQNLKLNYLQDLETLKRQIELNMRPSKEDPVFTVNKIEIYHDTEYCELTSELLKELISSKVFNFGSKAEKFQVKVYVSVDATPTSPLFKINSRQVSKVPNRQLPLTDEAESIRVAHGAYHLTQTPKRDRCKVTGTDTETKFDSPTEFLPTPRKALLQTASSVSKVRCKSSNRNGRAATSSTPFSVLRRNKCLTVIDDVKTEEQAFQKTKEQTSTSIEKSTDPSIGSDLLVVVENRSVDDSENIAPSLLEGYTNQIPVIETEVNPTDEIDKIKFVSSSSKTPSKEKLKPSIPKIFTGTKSTSTVATSVANNYTYNDSKTKFRTVGEIAASFADTLRKDTSSNSSTDTNSSTSLSTRKAAILKSTQSAKKGAVSNMDDLFSFSSMSLDYGGGLEGGGRPSIGTITRQWQFLRTNFVNGDSGELEWLMVSKRTGAYNYAHTKFEAAEDKYFKSLCEIDRFGSNAKKYAKIGKLFIDALEPAVNSYSTLQSTPTHEESLALVSSSQQICQEFLIKNNSFLNMFTKLIQSSIDDFLIENNKTRAARFACTIQKDIISESTEFSKAYNQSIKDSDDSLKDMEKWRKRETLTDDYHECMNKMEKEWFEKEFISNQNALEMMQSFLPLGITDMTSDYLKLYVEEKNGFFSEELIMELKKNKFLHWIITHKKDIELSNFLIGEGKPFFENLEIYDVIELRGLCLCIPDKFELDGDGKKAEWRTRFMARVKLLVSQQNGDMVKGGWHFYEAKRSMIRLPSLKPEQERRSMYFYRTKKQCDVRINQYDEKEISLIKKMDLLNQAIIDEKESKAEYDTILVEMRDQGFKATYGVDKLLSIKQIAKDDWKEKENQRKILQDQVIQLNKVIKENPMSREKYIANIKAMSVYLTSKGYDWENIETPIKVIGVFDTHPIITRNERKATKFLSPEEEANKRKEELTLLKDNNNNKMDKLQMDEMESNVVAVISQQDNSVSSIALTGQEISADESNDNSLLLYSTSQRLIEMNDEEDDGLVVNMIDENIAESSLIPSFNDQDIPVVLIEQEKEKEVVEEVPLSARGEARGYSVLVGANPDMISCLNSMLRSSTLSIASSNAKLTPRGCSTRNQTLKQLQAPLLAVSSQIEQVNVQFPSAAETLLNLPSSTSSVVSNVVLKPQSKLLRKLAESQLKSGDDSPSSSSSSSSDDCNTIIDAKSSMSRPPKMMMTSLFDQIKLKKADSCL